MQTKLFLSVMCVLFASSNSISDSPSWRIICHWNYAGAWLKRNAGITQLGPCVATLWWMVVNRLRLPCTVCGAADHGFAHFLSALLWLFSLFHDKCHTADLPTVIWKKKTVTSSVKEKNVRKVKITQKKSVRLNCLCFGAPLSDGIPHSCYNQEKSFSSALYTTPETKWFQGVSLVELEGSLFNTKKNKESDGTQGTIWDLDEPSRAVVPRKYLRGAHTKASEHTAVGSLRGGTLNSWLWSFIANGRVDLPDSDTDGWTFQRVDLPIGVKVSWDAPLAKEGQGNDQKAFQLNSVSPHKKWELVGKSEIAEQVKSTVLSSYALSDWWSQIVNVKSCLPHVECVWCACKETRHTPQGVSVQNGNQKACSVYVLWQPTPQFFFSEKAICARKTTSASCYE